MINRVSIVLAYYCPHCVPFSLSNAGKMAKDFGVPLRVLDIQKSEEERVADRLVEEYGDWSEDYLVPQVFIEYENNRVEHLLTGFSESVLATKAAWKALFSSKYYKTLLHQQTGVISNSIKTFVPNNIQFTGQCRLHCDQNTSLVELWSDVKRYAGAYVCPNGYAARLLCFTQEADIKWFKNFLTKQVGKDLVKDRDLRIATRHGWELGGDLTTEIRSLSSTGKISAVYWTTYPQTEEEKRRGVFVCSDPQTGKGCRRLFVQEITSTNRFCPHCE
jgi:glutaredoxin